MWSFVYLGLKALISQNLAGWCGFCWPLPLLLQEQSEPRARADLDARISQPLDIDSSTASIGSMYAHSTPLPVRQNMNPHSFPSRTTQDPESPSTIQGSEISAVFNLNHFRKKLPKGRSRDKDLTSKNDPDIMIEAECRFKNPN